MRIFDISFLGWLHTFACLAALPTGFAVLAMIKGTRRHRQLGLVYFYAMVAANLTAFGLYGGVPGIEPGFNRFHWMAAMTLAALLVAYIGARRQREAIWAYLHPAGMIISYYFLIGGLINEVFSRVLALQAYRGSAVGMLQAVNMLIFAVLLAAAVLGVRRRRTAFRRAMS